METVAQVVLAGSGAVRAELPHAWLRLFGHAGWEESAAVGHDCEPILIAKSDDLGNMSQSSKNLLLSIHFVLHLLLLSEPQFPPRLVQNLL